MTLLITTNVEYTHTLEVADSRPSQIASGVYLPASLHILCKETSVLADGYFDFAVQINILLLRGL